MSDDLVVGDWVTVQTWGGRIDEGSVVEVNYDDSDSLVYFVISTWPMRTLRKYVISDPNTIFEIRKFIRKGENGYGTKSW